MSDWLFERLQRDVHKKMGFGNLAPFDQEAEGKKLKKVSGKSSGYKKQKKDDDGNPETITYMSIDDFNERKK